MSKCCSCCLSVCRAMSWQRTNCFLPRLCCILQIFTFFMIFSKWCLDIKCISIIYLAGNDQIRTNLFQPPSDWLLVCRLCSVIGGSQLFHNTRCLCTKFSVAAVYFSKTVYLHFVSWREWKIIFRFSMLLQYQWIRIRVKRRTFKGELIWNIDIRIGIWRM